MREVTPTRNTARELAEERRLMRQGYEFLDEKRMLLAMEILRQLQIYHQQSRQLDEQLKAAAAALANTVQRHGLDHLQLYPAPPESDGTLIRNRSAFLGLILLQVGVSPKPSRPAPPAIDPSPEAKACRAAFDAVLRTVAQIGACAGNLRRLAREYRRTERRAKALENILLPEVEETIKAVEEQLDTMEREEAIRAKWSAGSAAPYTLHEESRR